MAGYFIYSIDWDSFQKFIKQPDDMQLEKFAETLDDQYENQLEQFEDYEEDDALAKSWSSEGDEPESAILKHLQKADWYSGVGQVTCGVWSRAIETMAQDFDFRVDSDGIYWNLIELATKKLGNQSDKCAAARFGRCPYSVVAIETFEPEERWDAWWDPYHSMHPPDEVQALLAEFESLSNEVESSGDNQAIEDFQELMPALKLIAQENRMLYVAVDT